MNSDFSSYLSARRDAAERIAIIRSTAHQYFPLEKRERGHWSIGWLRSPPHATKGVMGAVRYTECRGSSELGG